MIHANEPSTVLWEPKNHQVSPNSHPTNAAVESPSPTKNKPDKLRYTHLYWCVGSRSLRIYMVIIGIVHPRSKKRWLRITPCPSRFSLSSRYLLSYDLISSIKGIPFVNHFVHSSIMNIPTETVDAKVACLVEKITVGRNKRNAW